MILHSFKTWLKSHQTSTILYCMIWNAKVIEVNERLLWLNLISRKPNIDIFRCAYQGKLLVVFPFHQWLQPHCRHLEFLFFWTGNCICRDQDSQNLLKSWKSHGFVAGRLHPKMEKYKNIEAHLNCSLNLVMQYLNSLSWSSQQKIKIVMHNNHFVSFSKGFNWLLN